MARSAARVADRPVHVHGSEVSTDGDSLWSYAEGIALAVAIMATLAAIWMAAMPSEGADIAKPAPVVAPGGYVIVTPDGTIQQPETEGPQEVAVVIPGGGAVEAGFGDPFGREITEPGE
jgi:hypothetical protein